MAGELERSNGPPQKNFSIALGPLKEGDAIIEPIAANASWARRHVGCSRECRMPQDPYRLGPSKRPRDDEDEHLAAKAASIALIAIVAAWFALGDRAVGRTDLIVGLFVTAVALLAGWRAGKGR
jgi:hypothetical protein